MLLAFIESLTALIFSLTFSILSIGAHWKGVNGLGTNIDVLTVTLRPLFLICLGTMKYWADIFSAKSPIPLTSSISS
ncbi:hypothetical protein D3C73_1291480 [compost metagenome]